MSKKDKGRILSERQIDKVVVAQADDDAAWGKPIRVRRAKAASLSLSGELAGRAAFFARVHREASPEDWLLRIIQERMDLEETVFAELKRDLATKHAG